MEPDKTLCRIEGSFKKGSSLTLELDKPECGSLRWSKAKLSEDALTENAVVLFAAADEIISEPSVKVNYALSLSVKDGGANVGSPSGLVITIPYVASVLSDYNFSVSLVGAFYKSQTGEDLSHVPRNIGNIDAELKKYSTELVGLGTYQPGVKVYENFEVGEVARMNMADSAGGIAVKVGGSEGFCAMVTSLEPGLLFEPMMSSGGSSLYQLESSEPSAAFLSKMVPNETLTKPIPSAYAGIPMPISIDSFLNEKFRRRVLDKKESFAKGLAGNRKITFPNGIVEGQVATGIYIWDYSGCVPSFSSGCDTLLENQQAVIHKVTPHGIFLIHNQSDYYNTVMTAQQKASVDGLALDFESIIWPRENFFFGEPSDVDANDRIIVLLTPTLNETGILGFFYSADIFANDGISPNIGGFGDSNEGEIIYSVVPSPLIHTLLLKSILAHEIQHLINFNNKSVKRMIGSLKGVAVDPDLLDSSVPLEEVFLNEGLSHFAEDVVGYADVTAGIPHILAHPSSSYYPYLKNNWRSSMIDSSGFGSFAMRGQNYLLIRYLYEQAGAATPVADESGYTDNGGAAFIKDLIGSSHVGIAEIDNVFPDHDPFERGFVDAYLDWLVALYNDQFDGSLNASTEYNYLQTYDDEMNVNQTVGIDLSDTRVLEDTGASITLSGPKVFDFTPISSTYDSEIANVGASFVRFKVPSTPSRDILVFELTGEASANLQGVVMRIE